jgi:hypothetical protein
LICELYITQSYVPLEDSSLIWRRQYCGSRGWCSILTALIVPSLLWYQASVFCGHIRRTGEVNILIMVYCLTFLWRIFSLKWGRQHCDWGAVKCKPMRDACSVWAGMDLSQYAKQLLWFWVLPFYKVVWRRWILRTDPNSAPQRDVKIKLKIIFIVTVVLKYQRLTVTTTSDSEVVRISLATIYFWVAIYL